MMSQKGSWSELLGRINVDPHATLPDYFLDQVCPLLNPDTDENMLSVSRARVPRTLIGVFGLLDNTIQKMGSVHVQRTLRAVYRFRRHKDPVTIEVQKAVMLQRTIEKELMKEEGADQSLATMLAKYRVSNEFESVAADINAYPDADEDRLLSFATECLKGGNSAAPQEVIKRYRDEKDIIGIKEFEVDEDALGTYLQHIFEYWNGDRKPEGVSEKDARRCG
ncbi:unnamed protein product [Peniophora sp. CBMAI 1063]|nr:unnamed protein product [Peniophora sp. CBMAI 1063]